MALELVSSRNITKEIIISDHCTKYDSHCLMWHRCEYVINWQAGYADDRTSDLPT